MRKTYELVEFLPHIGRNGSLIMYQPGKHKDALPFDIKKVLLISGMKEEDVRGNHAHYETTEVLVCVQGSCTVELDDGQGKKESVRLDNRETGLLLYPLVWRTMNDFSKNTILLIIANREYDEKDYIRDYKEFLRIVAGSGA